MLRWWAVALAVSELATHLLANGSGVHGNSGARVNVSSLLRAEQPAQAQPAKAQREFDEHPAQARAAPALASQHIHRPDDDVSAVVSSKGTFQRTKPRRHAVTAHALKVHESKLAEDFNGAVAWVEARAPNISNSVKQLPAGEEKPNHLFFGIGCGVFLLCFLIIFAGVKKMNYLEMPMGTYVEEASSSAANPQAEDEPSAGPSVPPADSRNPRHPGLDLPFRMQQVLISWVFIIASVAFFLDYLALQAQFNNIRHWFGVVASLLWLGGFLISLHWQVSVGSNNVQMLGSFFKVLACVMGQVHPMSMIMGMKESDPGVWWPAVTGIASWHIGNIIGTTDNYFRPPPGTNARQGVLAHANLPLTEMWVDQMATWLLLIAGIGITQWWGRPEKQLVDTNNIGIVCCQFGGAAFFLLASCIKCEWCNGFQNCSHYTEDETPTTEALGGLQG